MIWYRRAVIAASLLALSTASPVSPSSASPIVDLGYSRYQGTLLSTMVDQYLGISYAAPPMGDLRWRAPADPLLNSTLQDATKVRLEKYNIFRN